MKERFKMAGPGGGDSKAAVGDQERASSTILWVREAAQAVAYGNLGS